MFLSNLRASVDRDPGADFWFEPVTLAPTQSGARVSVDSAMQLSTVYKCVRVIAESLGMLPAHHYRTQRNGRQRIRDSALARLLANRPNAWQTPMQFRTMLEAHCSLRGNAYAEVLWGSNGEPSDLVPLHPDRVTPEVSEVTGLPRYRVKSRRPGEPERVLLQGEILHLAGLSLDGYTGLSPIGLQREALGSAIASRDYGSRFWNNDARPPFWIKVPGKFEDSFAKTNFRNEWQASYGGSNRGKPAVLDRGMEIQELGLNNADAQWLESRKHSDIDICGLWRVPPHKIGILDRATWGNVEQQNIDFVTDCLLPRAVGWEQTIFRDLITDPDEFIEILLEQLMRGDLKTRYEAYSKGINDGWLVRNEVRALENRNPLPGLDDPLQPMNMARANQATTLPGGGTSPGRAAAVLAAAAQRVARKEFGIVRNSLQRGDDVQALTAAFAGHDRFVADVLAVSAEAAAGYCAALLARAADLVGTEAAALTLQAWAEPQVTALLRLEN